VLGAESWTVGRSVHLLANPEYQLGANFLELGEMMILANMALGQDGQLGGKLLFTVEEMHTHEMQGRLYSEEERQGRR